MNKQTKRPLKLFNWILFTTFGWVIGYILLVLLMTPLDKIHFTFSGIGLGMGAGMGFM